MGSMMVGGLMKRMVGTTTAFEPIPPPPPPPPPAFSPAGRPAEGEGVCGEG